MIILDSPHLNLIRTEADHFHYFLPLDMDAEVMSFIRGPAKDEAESQVRFKRLLDYNAGHPTKGAFSVFTDDGDFVGFGFLINIELKAENPDHEIGYRLARQSWGKGYATEIAEALIQYGFNELKLEVIYGTTDPKHIVSQRVLTKVGMEDIGLAPYYNGCRIFKINRP